MRGVGEIDAIESVTFRHEEGNEGEKIGVERGNGAFYGAKLLKKQGTDGPPAPLLRRDHSMVGEMPAERALLSASSHGFSKTSRKL
jgi:hypothetical protein